MGRFRRSDADLRRFPSDCEDEIEFYRTQFTVWIGFQSNSIASAAQTSEVWSRLSTFWSRLKLYFFAFSSLFFPKLESIDATINLHFRLRRSVSRPKWDSHLLPLNSSCCPILHLEPPVDLRMNADFVRVCDLMKPIGFHRPKPWDLASLETIPNHHKSPSRNPAWRCLDSMSQPWSGIRETVSFCSWEWIYWNDSWLALDLDRVGLELIGWFKVTSVKCWTLKSNASQKETVWFFVSGYLSSPSCLSFLSKTIFFTLKRQSTPSVNQNQSQQLIHTQIHCSQARHEGRSRCLLQMVWLVTLSFKQMVNLFQNTK